MLPLIFSRCVCLPLSFALPVPGRVIMCDDLHACSALLGVVWSVSGACAYVSDQRAYY